MCRRVLLSKCANEGWREKCRDRADAEMDEVRETNEGD